MQLLSWKEPSEDRTMREQECVALRRLSVEPKSKDARLNQTSFEHDGREEIGCKKESSV